MRGHGDHRHVSAGAFSRSRIAAVASKPSISGIWMSISTTSKELGGQHQRHLRSVLRHFHGMTGLFQNAACHQLVDLVVFGQQDAETSTGPADLRARLGATAPADVARSSG